MYLKRLELLGFKSFPDKTVVKLTPGVTSIVGPNGCGKTNILDAIRWVLGEQKVSQLRGSKMEEIIFNGTRDIKPLGMAEITLVVQNSKGLLPTEYSEVQITRRLFRSGESEYLINKVPCRLKDITELFMDTGLGAHVYSVIQQHMIEAILSDRADDRRFLFEEAAGISKYKNRKKAAIRKLDATENDLLRLKDIVAEISSQVNSLKRQMNKARRYKELSEELKGWEIFLGKTSVEEKKQQRRDLLIERDTLTDKKVQCDTEIDALSADQESERKKLTDIDRRMTEISGQIYEKTELAHEAETEISVLRERRENASQIKTKNADDIEAYKTRKELLQEQIENVKQEIVSVRENLDSLDTEIKDSESNLSIADEKVLDARQKYDVLNRQLMEIEGRLSVGRSDDSNLKEQESEINATVARIESEIKELENKKIQMVEKRADLENELFTLKSKVEKGSLQKGELEDQISTISDNLDEIGARVFDLSASLEAAEARRNLLSEMVMQYEGFSSGVVAVMEQKERWTDLIGTVADNFIPKAGFEEAIEASLGEMAGYLICKSRTCAEDIVNYLKMEKKGRAGFLITGTSSDIQNTTRPDISIDGFKGWADNMITPNEAISSLNQLLLSRTAVVSPDVVEKVFELLPDNFSLVTTDGKYYESRTVMTGGSREGLSLLGRKEKIEEQDRKISELRNELEKYKSERNESTRMLGSRQAELNNVITEIEQNKENVVRVEHDLTVIRYDIQTVDSDTGRLTSEKNGLSAKLEALKTRQYTLNLSSEELNKEKTNLQNIISEHETKTKELEAESETAENNHANLQIRQVELKSKIQQFESQLNHTNELIGEIDNNITTKTEEIELAETGSITDSQKIVELETRLKEIFEERDTLTKRQNEIREEHDAVQEMLDNREQHIKSLRQTREESSAKLHSTEIRITEIDSSISNLKQNINEEYNIDIEAVTAENPNLGVPAEERAARMQELKERLRDFGGVNLLALEEYEAAKERQDFLSAQMEDLLNAKATLQSTISKINQTAKKLFSDTFEQVRDNFKKVFEELFTGGESDIRMTNPEDPLESAIEIIARPRGKKLLSIAQMSGGERALTAISLLFAIYLVKPSPFCILDEIDAPLDDANCHRFLRIIRTFSEQTQFIIITHNKITMEAADNLYGITMEQPGVSRVVSVRFADDEDDQIIDTSGKLADDEDTAIPEAIKERITPKVNIPTDNMKNE